MKFFSSLFSFLATRKNGIGSIKKLFIPFVLIVVLFFVAGIIHLQLLQWPENYPALMLTSLALQQDLGVINLLFFLQPNIRYYSVAISI